MTFAKEKLGLEFEVTKSADDSVSKADVFGTATTSSTPVFDSSAVRPGTHINAIDSNMLARRELDAEILKRPKVLVDSLE